MIERCNKCERKYTKAMLIQFQQAMFCIRCFNRSGYENQTKKSN